MTCKQSARNVFVWDAREKVESFSSFLCCGINLYGAGSTYNLLSHDGLAKKISQFVLRTIDSNLVDL